MNSIFRKIRFLLFLPLLFSSCSEKNPVDTTQFLAYEWEVSSPQSQGLDPFLLSEAVSEAGSKGYVKSLLIVRNGYLVSEDYFNPARHSRNDPWQVRSATKSFSSALVGIALSMSLIDSIDQRVLDFFPEYATPDLDPRKHNITIRHLLTMTSGLPSDEAYELPSGYFDYMKAIVELELVSDPGQSWNYSSLGAHLLSGVITRTAGMSTLEFAQKYLSNRLSISIPFWGCDPQGHCFGGSGLSLMPRDMARFGYLYLREGLVDGKQILPAEWVRESLQNQVDRNTSARTLQNWGYGYLWWTAELGGYQTACAAGFAGQYILLVPELDMVIVTTAGFPDTFERAHEQEDWIILLIKDYILAAAGP